MKKYFIVLTIIILVSPSVTFASWWNPFSWFSSNKVDKTEVLEKRIQELESRLSTNTSTTTDKFTNYYVKYDNTHLRKCASVDCSIEGNFSKNQIVSFTGPNSSSLSVLPEWLEINISDGRKLYLNKTTLSEVPMNTNRTKTVVRPNTKNSDIESIKAWISDIDRQRQDNSDLLSKISSSGSQRYLLEAISLTEIYTKNLLYIREQLNSVYQQLLSNTGDSNIQTQKVISLIDQYKKIKEQFVSDFQLSLDNSKQLYNSDMSAKQQYLDSYYQQLRADQNAINQARMNAVNTQIQQYNNIRAVGASEGVTEGVINSQLNAAGLIRQINCTTSSVGGMTPNGGSITCY